MAKAREAREMSRFEVGDEVRLATPPYVRGLSGVVLKYSRWRQKYWVAITAGVKRMQWWWLRESELEKIEGG